MISLNISAEIRPAAEIVESCGLGDHGPVQQAIDLAVINYMVPYWAYDTGRLANSAYTDTDIGSGEIVYGVSYASEMYYGIRENGAPVNYHLDKNPQAGAYPLERMLADHYADIVEEARKVAGNQQLE